MISISLRWWPFIVATVLLGFLWQALKHSATTVPTKITATALLIYLESIAFLCLTPTSYNFDQVQVLHYAVWGPVKYVLVPFQQIDLEWWLNILMTIPFGFLLPLCWPNLKLKHLLLIGLMTGLTLETSQFILDWLVNLGRWVETDDVLTNWAGVVIGASLYQILSHTIFKNWLEKFQIK